MSTDLDSISHISQILLASLDPRTNKQAELALRNEERKPRFSLALLHIVAGEEYGPTIRLAGALCFKNFLKRNWTDEDGNHKLPAGEVTMIKQEIIGLMISVPPNLQSQLGDAVGIIADSDFYRGWETLVDDLVSRLTADNSVVNNGVLQVAHSIFKRWIPLFRSDELFSEINHVLEKFSAPFLSLLENTDALIEQNRKNPARLKELFTTLNLMMKLLYDLSCQDLPPAFEDSIAPIASLLQKYLTFDEPSLHTDTDEEAGPLEFLKSAILEVLGLYVQKYEDAFGEHVGVFLQSSWNLLTTTGTETKYDILVSKALQFVTSVTRITQHAQTFNDEANMGQVVEKVVLPNLTLRDSDMELFEDEPIEFIRRDLEGSDSDTRRRAATDLLRGLMAQFEKLVTDVVFKYIDHYLAEFAVKPAENWRSKDTAVYLYSTIAAKGVVTAREGVKTVNPLVNVMEFFQKNVANDLVAESGVEPILKVDAIKYLYVFRSQMSKEQWSAAFPLMVQNLASSHYVVYSYAAIAVERVLALTDGTNQPLVGRDAVTPLSKDLIEHLFKLIEKDKGNDKVQAAAKIQENEFLMRCVMRVLIVIQESVVPLTDLLLSHFVEILDIISVNPSNPRFYYYLFEALGAVIRFAAPSQPQAIENKLYPPFASILENDVQDFIPYVFQLFAALLEGNPSGTLSDYYKTLIPPILKMDYWLTKGNVPALVRLLSSMLNRAAPEFISSHQIEPVLGIFKQLYSTKANEIQAYELLECILSNFPPPAMQNYYVPLMQMVLTKLDKIKSEATNTRFVRLYHFISASGGTSTSPEGGAGMGADFFVAIVDQIQENIFPPIYLTVVLPGTPKLVRPIDRKTAVISLTKTLADSVAFAEKYKKGWGYTCDRLLELLINPPVPTNKDEIIAENDVDDSSFGVGFTQLVTIKKPPRDNWSDVAAIKPWVGSYLKAADARHGGKISGYVQQRLSPESQQALLGYMQG